MMKTLKCSRGDRRHFRIERRFAYIGKRISPVEFYQVGYSLGAIGTMYFNMKKKPMIRNLAVLDWLLFVPYLFFLIYLFLRFVFIGLVWVLLYVSIGCYPDAIKDFGWNKRYLIVPIVFWQVLAIVLVVYILKN